MGIAIGTYIKLTPGQCFQNFHADDSRLWNGASYLYAGFGYSGSTVDLQAGNVEAQLVFAINEMSLSVVQQVVDQRQVIQIDTVWLNPETLSELSNYTTDRFMATGYTHDHSRLALRLSSPLDAISGDVPRRRLTTKLVGALPSSGDITLL